MAGEILSTSEYDEFLSDEAQSEGDIDLRVELAEIKVVDRYRESRENALAWYFEGELDPTAEVRLVGWATEPDGTVDVQRVDDELLRRLRLVIAEVVEWSLDYETHAHLDSETVGSKSVSYADAPTIPSRLFRLLRRFDEREPVSGLW
jgi:hypothetical protein